MTMHRSLLISLQQYQRTHDKAVQLFGLFEDAESSGNPPIYNQGDE